MADDWHVRHWTVEDDRFTDRWEVEREDGRYGWVDRVVDEAGMVWFECSVGGVRYGSYAKRDLAMDVLKRALRWEVPDR